MRTIYWYLNFIFSLILTMPKLMTAKKREKNMEPNEFSEFVHKITRDWAMKQIKASGGRFHVDGLSNIPKGRAVLFVSNHQGNFDIAMFLALIPVPKGYIAKVELLKIPILRTWMKYINCIFMDRSDLKKSAKAILDGIKLLKSGYSMVVFPEGTRSRGGEMGEFKAGSFKLATKSRVPIIPVTINGSYKLMEEQGGRITPADVYVIVHPAVETLGMSKDEELNLPESIREIIASSF